VSSSDHALFDHGLGRLSILCSRLRARRPSP
jgi:hypothetical protein